MKNLLIFIIVFALVLGIGLFCNYAFGVTFNGYNLGNSSEMLSALDDEICIVTIYNGNYKIFHTDNTDANITVDLTSKYIRSNISINQSYFNYNDGSFINSTFYKNEPYTDILFSNIDLYNYSDGTLYREADFFPFVELKNGSKFSIFNSSNTVLNSNIILKLNQLATGTVFLTDEDGNFKEQIGFDYTTGYNLTINLEPQKITNVYVAFTGDDALDSYFKLDLLQYDYLDVSNYTPTYKISGGSTISLEGLSIPNTQPFIQSNATTEFFYKYRENSIDYVKKEYLSPNEKFYFTANRNYLIKFLHESTTTISVQSNFTLNNTQERISLLDDDSLSDLIIDNGGVYTDNSDVADHYYEINRFKTFKLTNKKPVVLGTGVMLPVTVRGSSNSNAVISWYAYDNGVLYKEREYTLNGNNTKSYSLRVSPGDGYIIIKESSGNIAVRVDGAYKEDEDFTVEFLTDYQPIQSVEDEFTSTNPDVINVSDANDNYVKPISDNLLDSISSGISWSGIGSDNQNDTSDFGLELTTVKGVVQNVSSFAQIFVGPVTTFFTGIPEIQGLMVFGFGLALVLMILGR